ncbi:hypothetical protein ACO0LC_27415 [Undibacterium sp. JH2W]|uniref:hypothetical protein n=1 Tax=Undibacterium sp. JH2W TaxID=3413037 RepID=UPI003BEF92FE
MSLRVDIVIPVKLIKIGDAVVQAVAAKDAAAFWHGCSLSGVVWRYCFVALVLLCRGKIMPLTAIASCRSGFSRE